MPGQFSFIIHFCFCRLLYLCISLMSLPLCLTYSRWSKINLWFLAFSDFVAADKIISIHSRFSPPSHLFAISSFTSYLLLTILVLSPYYNTRLQGEAQKFKTSEKKVAGFLKPTKLFSSQDRWARMRGKTKKCFYHYSSDKGRRSGIGDCEKYGIHLVARYWPIRSVNGKAEIVSLVDQTVPFILRCFGFNSKWGIICYLWLSTIPILRYDEDYWEMVS